MLMVLIVAGSTGCREVPDNSLAFDDVVYVDDEYPVTWELTEGDTLDIPVLGASDFVIKDSLLIVSTNDNSGYVTVLSLDGKQSWESSCGRDAVRERQSLSPESAMCSLVMMTAH